ncbi:chemotaxis response regulator protein-glutamate methylesterase of group 2 operon [Terrihabitans soli]|uniref:Protein-glutamate methylesterase/protein-glutamine glutaminase n=2 Tax=Terrihabitans soli TaxID=708113 RepID=A0A6S6QFU6_9HYPH|nr:chemotaxis response regulator protein-glutamate methylesterase of group 2 operon [Terrihabitans soli]
MVVDDALVVRGIVSRWLQEERGVEVVATHRSAKGGLDDLFRVRPDVLILDIEMPDMDGVTALPLFLSKQPGLAVIVASTLTRRNAELSIRCLSLGAMDCLAKPQTSGEMTSTNDFRRELIDRVRALGGRAVARARRQGEPAPPPIAPRTRPAVSEVLNDPAQRSGPPDNSFLRRSNEPLRVRKMPAIVPRALVIGSSTGGPQALAVLFAGIKPLLPRVPVLVTQHMPPSFTTILAEHLGRVAGVPCHEPVDGEHIHAGTIYVAPGGKHMKVAQSAEGPVVRITDEPPVNFCKPAVDPLFYSARDLWGNHLLAVVLTGMGSDGARGALAIAEAGGAVIAQDEETSVVWGMPGATAHAGACSAILPLNSIAPQLVSIVTGERR